MKSTIMYYYNLDHFNIYHQKDKIFIKYKGEIYVFQMIHNEKETIEIFQLLRNYKDYYSFIMNRFHQILTPYQGKQFVLLKRTNNKRNFMEDLFKTIYVMNGKYNNNRSNWYFLWTQKNDYFEYQIEHIEGKYPLIDESIDYFLGMAETAISYIQYNIDYTEPSKENLAICHRRIKEDEFYNPLNVIIDYKERDFGEYLKYLFWKGKYKREDIVAVIRKARCDNQGYHRLYGRLLYPSYYFDLYEKIVNENESEQKIKNILERTKEYENYLNMIYEEISKITEIKRVDWL